MSSTISLTCKRAPRQAALPVSAGFTLTLVFILSLAAIVARGQTALIILTLINAGLLILYRCERRTLFRLIRLFLMQGGVVTTLYLLREGVYPGMIDGLRTSWQLMLAFSPGLITLHTIPTSSMARLLGRALPARGAFVLASSLRFLPLLLTEISAIYEAQLLRGARIRPRDLLWPGYWPDFLGCLIAPAVVQALELADNIAKAASSREFGRYPRRTYWPAEQEHQS